MILVTYKIKGGDTEYHEYSWFSMGTQHDYEIGVIKSKVLIQEVYGDDEEEIFENNYDDDTNTYENYNNDWVSVHSVKDITPKELDVLDKFRIICK
jgi:hypothetical protein|tara:strand:+ start:167 stop:454 length:288 start_codon:yes stop_codon:yes gene_type:complete